MRILVINCGSSSIKGSVIDTSMPTPLAQLKVERLEEQAPRFRVGEEWHDLPAGAGHAAALEVALPRLIEATGVETLDAVGHRVVHGGERFVRPSVIDDSVVAGLEDLVPLAPLHNPHNIAGIRAARRLFPDVVHVAVFDTAFHSTLPRRSRSYALPWELAEKHGIRRYGFHGISHGFVADRVSKHLSEDIRNLRIITCHLGNGCSVCAVEYGRSVETSMGMTPLEGLAMGTRVGDLDPGVAIALQRAEGWGPDELDAVLNRESGLAGLSGVGNDMRDIEARAADGDEHCRHAIQVFAHRVRKYIGAYAAVMGGVDAIAFAGGIGENSSVIRHRIAQRLDFLGGVLDEDRNRDARVTAESPVAEISPPHARARLLVVATDEAHAIATDTAKVVAEHRRGHGVRAIPVAISARHVHLTQEDVEALFGAGHKLTERNPLSQPGQFAAHETVTIVGPKRSIERVRVLGPTRPQTQVEVSRTDEFYLGIDAPVRASGDVENTPGCKLVGPAGEVVLKQGVICAWRHIHATTADAEFLGVKDRDVVEVAITGTGRDLVFGDVLVRVKDSYRLEMHIDTDEGNAAELSTGTRGVLVGTEGTAVLKARKTRYDHAHGSEQER